MNKQIKSKKRVKEFAEVYTNEREVKAMCDLIPEDVWNNIESTFLEPACGNGNFLVEIYARKLERCKDEKDGLKALSSIVGIDIQQDNVDESRLRLRSMFLDKFPNANSFCLYMLATILCNNIICANSLEKMQEWIDEENANESELYEIYRCELGGNKPIEELKVSTWTMLKAMWYLRNIKENEQK